MMTRSGRLPTSRNCRAGVLIVCGMAMLGASASIVLGGCRAAPTSDVASVDGTEISGAALAHWTDIKRLELERSTNSTSASNLARLKRQALVFLITAEWLQGEAKSQDINVSASEVDATYRELLNGPSGQSFARSMRNGGISRADELLLLRLQQLSNKLQAKIASGHIRISAGQIVTYYRTHPSRFHGSRSRAQTLAAAKPAIRNALVEFARERQVAAFAAAYRQRWKQRTTCEPGYIVPECNNGPPLPSAPVER
jgi:SurA N-terminal domain